MRVAVVVSRYNGSVTSRLLQGAVACAERAGVGVEVVEAPGAYELTALAAAAADTGRFAGVVALGCIIRGDTDHDRYIAAAVAHGLTEVTLRTGVPVAFGVLTVNNAAQARARAGGSKGNKGEEACGALLDTIAAIRGLRSAPGRSAGPLGPKPDKAARTRKPRTP